MHFITGGFFNGKSQWVRSFYHLAERNDATWVSAYENMPFPAYPHNYKKNIIILEGAELWIKEITSLNNMKDSRGKWQNVLREWKLWETESQERTIAIIGSDITKGIVPVERENRNWRDCTGWAYQDIAALAGRVDLIWYGISQRLK